MKHHTQNPLFLPLAGVLNMRGVRVRLACELNRSIHDSIRVGSPRMKELKLTAPLLAEHRCHSERRMVIALNNQLDVWREKLLRRGINMLAVSEDGLIANVEGIADTICQHIYRVAPDDLREMVQRGMPLPAISAFTGIKPPELSRIVTRFFGKTIIELREELA